MFGDAQAQRVRFLAALYRREQAGEECPGADTIAAEIGVPVSDWDAIKRITRPLHEDGLIAGIDTWRAGLVRVKLTAAGRRLVEGGGEPAGG